MAKNPAKVEQTRDLAARIAPYATGNALPANTVAWDGTWGGSWVDAGYTSGGLHVTAEVGRSPVEVDQELDPILLVATSRTTTMVTNLSEFDVDNIVTATGQGSVTSTAATTAARGYEEYIIGSTVSENATAIGFDVKGRDGEPIRMAGWRGIATGGFALDFMKDSSTGVLIPVSMQLTPDPNNSNRILTIRDVSPIAA